MKNQSIPLDIDELAELQRENTTLAEQIKSLIKAEGKLYEYQQQLDAQLKEYQTLYELNRQISATFDIREIFSRTLDYVIRNLEYERVLFLQQNETSGTYQVCALDGFYEQDERQRVEALRIAPDDSLLGPLREGAEYLLWQAEMPDPGDWRCRLLLDEFLLYPLGSRRPAPALIVVGNSAANAGNYRRIDAGKRALLGMGNLVGLLSARVDNAVFYASMEAALEQQKRAEAKFRGIFENAAEGIVQVHPDGWLLSCNPAAAAILGYGSPEELLLSISDIGRQLYVQPSQRREMYLRLERGEPVDKVEVEFYRKDHSRQWVLVSIRPVRDAEGKILYVDGMVLDIAERKRAEQALQNLNEELEQRVAERTGELETALQELKDAQSRVLQQEKMASIGQLAAGVAHEINNPMGFIISNLNTLKTYVDKLTGFLDRQAAGIETLADQADNREIPAELANQRQSLKLDYIRADLGDLIGESLEGAERVKTIVQNLKNFSRLEASEQQLADINEGLESTINIVWNEIKYKAELVRKFGEIPRINCHLGQLNQVFLNLLVNAAQAMDDRGQITVATACEDGQVVITIADTGAGIPPDKLGRIFEPFFTTKEVGQGTGLGLSIAYDIIQNHQGSIKVESEVGRGTTFIIHLPVS